MSDKAYEIRVNGLIPTERLVDELRAVEVAEHEVRTVLTGHFPDQSALYGFLNLLRAYGLEVVEVRRTPGPGADQSASPGPAARRGSTGGTPLEQ